MKSDEEDGVWDDEENLVSKDDRTITKSLASEDEDEKSIAKSEPEALKEAQGTEDNKSVRD